MKHLMILFVFFILSVNSFSQGDPASGCLKYHKGKFTYTDSAHNLIQLHRKHKYQFETNTVTRVRIQYRIRWKSDCEYELEQVSTNSKALRKFNHGISTTIITNASGDDGYEYRCGCKGKDIPDEPEFMKKVNSFYSPY